MRGYLVRATLTMNFLACSKKNKTSEPGTQEAKLPCNAVFLVTGGAGFIGSNLVKALIRKGHNVRILDNFSTGRIENLEGFTKDIKLFEGDVRDVKTVRKAMEGISFCFHQAALTSVKRSFDNPLETTEVNVIGTVSVLLSAKAIGNVRVIYASSASVYGTNPHLPRKENLSPQPVSPYAASKLTGENYCSMFYSTFGVPVVILRYFNVFGLNQRDDSQYAAVIPKFTRALKDGKAPEIYGDGEQTRDFTHVDNVVGACLLACEKDDAVGEIFNIGCGGKTTINKILKLMSAIGKVRLKPVYREERSGDVRHSEADIRKAKDILGYEPHVGLEEGLRLTLSGQ